MEKKFYGYPREDGSVGIRNHVLIVPVQRVLNALASQISSLVSGTETTEVIGTEHILLKRAENEAVGDALL
jgi:altronate dehydratase